MQAASPWEADAQHLAAGTIFPAAIKSRLPSFFRSYGSSTD